MLLWMSFAVLTAVVLAVVLRPALAPVVSERIAAATADIAVYTDQLNELDLQLAQGQLQPVEHAALKNEVARRILSANDPARVASARPIRAFLTKAVRLLVERVLAPLFGRLLAWSAGSLVGAQCIQFIAAARRALSDPLSPRAIRAVTFGIAVAVPSAALALYLALGAPFVPARPFAAATTSLANASAADLIAKVEARLAADPNDGRGWDVIAPVYFRLERFADAAQAYQRALTLQGETSGRLAGFAEATVLANDGIVTEPARAAYEKLARLVPDRIEPRFWLALAKEQDGQRDAAAADYRALLASAAANDTSRALIEQRLAAVTAPPSTAPRGPTATDVDAAANLSEADRRAMIAQMVDNLAARLQANARDFDGWQRLVNAYVVLKDPIKARAALADARAAFQGDAAAAPVLADLSRRVEALQ